MTPIFGAKLKEPENDTKFLIEMGIFIIYKKRWVVEVKAKHVRALSGGVGAVVRSPRCEKPGP